MTNAVTNTEPRSLTFHVGMPVPGHRRRFTLEQKREIVREAEAPGETMSSVGRKYGLSVSLLFRWKRDVENAPQQDASAQSSESSQESQTIQNEDKDARIQELERLLGRQLFEKAQLQSQLDSLMTQRTRLHGMRSESNSGSA